VKEMLEKLQTRIDEKSLRERVLLFLAIIALLYLVWQSLLMGPMEAQQKKLLSRLEGVRNEISKLEQQTQAILKRRDVDPNANNRKLLAQYQEQIEALEEQIRSSIQGLIKPQQMTAVLESVLTRDTDLSLVSVRNLKPEPLVAPDPEQDEGATEAAGIYKHGMQLEFTGKYLSALGYLKALEQLEWGFHWDSIDITMGEYPTAHIVITVHTLSLEEGWIGV
jgi:MSHA biogenesis protein MshJ